MATRESRASLSLGGVGEVCFSGEIAGKLDAAMVGNGGEEGVGVTRGSELRLECRCRVSLSTRQVV